MGGAREDPACVIYEYTPTPSQPPPNTFKGIDLQADAYPGYNSLYKEGQGIEVACGVPARRKYMNVVKITKKLGLAEIAVDYIGQLYQVDRNAKYLTPLHRKYHRRKYEKPMLKAFFRWLCKTQKDILPTAPLSEAIFYTLNS